jgi:hypothetical protein
MNGIDVFVLNWVDANGIQLMPTEHVPQLAMLNRPGKNYPVLMQNWQSMTTLGYGTCLIYAFLGAASPTYRRLPVAANYKHHLAVGLELRAYLATNPRGFNATPNEIQSLQNFLGQTAEGIPLMEELSDSIAERIADFFHFSLIMLNEYNNLDIPIPQVRDIERGYPVIIIRIRGGIISLQGSQSGEHYETVVIPQYQGLQFISPNSLCGQVVPLMNEAMELSGALIDQPQQDPSAFSLAPQKPAQAASSFELARRLQAQSKSDVDEAASLALIRRLQAQGSPAATDDPESLALALRLQRTPSVEGDAASLALARQLQAQGSPAATGGPAPLALMRHSQADEDASLALALQLQGTPSAAGDASSLALARQLREKPESWTCIRCGFTGSEGRKNCTRCGAPRVRKIMCHKRAQNKGDLDLPTAKEYARSAGIPNYNQLHKPELCDELIRKGVFQHNGEWVIVANYGKRISRKRMRRRRQSLRK